MTGRSIQNSIRVDRLGGLGDGLGALGNRVIAVPFAAPGDLVDVDLVGKGQRVAGRIRTVVEAGPDRVDPPCPHFGRCGGCRMQHIAATAYVGWKDDLWRTALTRAGIKVATIAQTEVYPLSQVDQQSRRRARLAVRKGKAGFRTERSHRIEPMTTCSVLEPSLLETAHILASLPALNGCDISLTLLDDGVEAVVHGLGQPDFGDLQQLADVAARLDLARLSHQSGREAPTPVAHRREGVVRFGGIAVVVPPAPFLQATRRGEEILRDLASGWLHTAKRVADLYSGCGAFALPLTVGDAGRRVLAVDRDGPAIEALSQAVRRSGLVGRLDCESRDLARDPLVGRELEGLDGVVFDPPRAGARAQAEALAASNVRDVVAVSCNPVSFARDASILLDGGYRLAAVAPLDQFLWTAHLELAAHFTRT